MEQKFKAFPAVLILDLESNYKLDKEQVPTRWGLNQKA